MPFGHGGAGEFGTYFIGYSRSPRTIEQMLVNMFVGRPPGNYDRLLDFSTAVTGNLFFVPTATFLDDVTPDPQAGPSPAPPNPPVPDGSLGIGSLKGDALTMNNLHRELAPISAEAWAEIEEEASRTLKRYLAGRRVVDVQGPAGTALSAVGTGHQKTIAAPARASGAPARGESAGRAARPVRAGSRRDRRCGARLGGFRLAAGEGRRAPDRLRRGRRDFRGL
jgi:hypothetical protein